MSDERTLEALREVLDSGRWAISGPTACGGRQERSREEEFAERFASYCGVRYGVALDHGTSALIAALEALDIGFGDEVVIPGLTWVAPAVAVLSVNAVPVLADIDPRTLCLDPHAAAEKITPRTKAIIAIHMYGSMADMDAIRSLADRYGLYVIEDAAHSHGAVWRGRKAGSLGHIGVFSMQQGKVLACGEGGAAVTDDPELIRRLEESAWNGRTRTGKAASLPFSMGLVEGRGRFGTNRCLSEFQAAILLDQLTRLDGQNERRERSARYLDGRLSLLPGIATVKRQEQVDRRTYYGYVVRIDVDRYGHASEAAARLRKLLGMGDYLLHPIYKPLYRNPLYAPHSRRHALGEAFERAVDPSAVKLGHCEEAYADAIVFHHSVLLAEEEDLQRIALAFEQLPERQARKVF